MNRSSSSWFGSPREALSATERARLAAKRAARLEQHMLPPQPTATLKLALTLASTPTAAAEPRGLREARDPLELQRGLEVQVLPESEFDRLFPHAPG